MTTFQDPPHQSRRALRESEREDRQAADATPQSREVPVPAQESLVPPVVTPNGEQPSSVASVSSVVEPDAEDGAPVVRSSGRRASRAAAQPGLIELQNSDGSASKAAEGEPLDYATQGRRQVPSYDGPGPSFAQRLREAEATSSRQDAEANASSAGEQPQYRVRDFSPEGRRSAAYPSQPTPAAPAAEQAPADLDYRTQAAPAPGSAPSAFEASVPEPASATGDIPALWSPRVAPAAPFPLVEPSAPASAFAVGPASTPDAAAAPASAAEPSSAAFPSSASFPTSAAEAPTESAAVDFSTGDESVSEPAIVDAQPDAAPQESAQPESAQPESAQPESAQPESAPSEAEHSTPEEPAMPQLFTPPAPQPPAAPADSYSASVSHPDSVTESNGIPMTRRELREMRAREEAAAALIEPEAPVATPAAVSNAIAEFEELARAAHNTAPVTQVSADVESPSAEQAALQHEDVPAEQGVPVQESPFEQFEAPVAPQPMSNFWAPAEPDAPIEAPTAPQPLAGDWAPAPAAPEPLGDAWAPAPSEAPESTPDVAPATSPSSLFSTNQPFSNWLPAEPVAPPVAPVAEEAPAAPPVDSVASVHSAPVPLESIIADSESAPDSSIARPFHWGPQTDDGAPEAAPQAAETVTPKSTPDPHATSFEELFAPVSTEPQPSDAEEPAAYNAGAYGTGSQSTADLFSQALASAAPPAYTPPVVEPVEEVPSPVYEAPKFDFSNYSPPSFGPSETDSSEPEPVDPAPVVEPELSLPEPPEEAAQSTANPGTYGAAASSSFGSGSALLTPTPAATPQDFLTPEFVEPPTTTASTYVAPVGHWSRQAIMDDETQPFENTLSREVGGGNVSTTTSALILPSIPQQDFTTGLSGTGEILVTGTIALPESFGTMGGDSRRYDNPDVDHVLDAFDNEVVSTDSAPVRATRAVSTHTNTHGVIQATRSNGDRLLKILLISASVLAVGVVALLVIGLVLK